MDYSNHVRKKLKKYGSENLEWVSEDKKEKVRGKHAIDPEKIEELLERGDFLECFPNQKARDNFDYEESFIVRIEKSSKYYYEIPIYFIKDEKKVIIATAYKNYREAQDELD